MGTRAATEGRFWGARRSPVFPGAAACTTDARSGFAVLEGQSVGTTARVVSGGHEGLGPLHPPRSLTGNWGHRFHSLWWMKRRPGSIWGTGSGQNRKFAKSLKHWREGGFLRRNLQVGFDVPQLGRICGSLWKGEKRGVGGGGSPARLWRASQRAFLPACRPPCDREQRRPGGKELKSKCFRALLAILPWNGEASPSGASSMRGTSRSWARRSNARREYLSKRPAYDSLSLR